MATHQIVRKTTFDFSALASGGTLSQSMPRRIPVTGFAAGTLEVRVHSATVDGSSDGRIAVRVRSSGHTSQDPARFYTGPTLALVTAAGAGSQPPKYLTYGFACDGDLLEVEVEGTQDSSSGGLDLQASLSLTMRLLAEAPSLPLLEFIEGTFSRSSQATWWDGTKVSRYAPGVLRQPTSILGRPAFALEGARTNEVPESSGNSGWSAVGATLTANQYTDPVGKALGAPQLSTTAVGSDRARETMSTLSDNTNYVASMFVARQGSAWSQNGPVIQMKDKAASTTTVTGATDGNDRGAGVYTRIVGSAWDASSGATTPEIRCRNNHPEAREIAFWGAQVEQGEFASSLIETSGSAATRAADDLQVSNGWTKLMAKKWQVWFVPSMTGAQLYAAGNNLCLFARTSGEYAIIQANSSGNFRLRVRDASGNQAQTSYVAGDSLGDVFRAEFDPATGEATLDNVTQGASESASNTSISMSDGDMYVGYRASTTTDPFFGTMTEPYAP